MAAPTPVSALVHSSTLVTAGVYLLIRFNHILISLDQLKYLIFVGMFTIFIAGLRANHELDIKKVIALSTLRQLGAIIIIIGAGYPLIGFFHLTVHAFFKALLFMCAGMIIHNFKDYQDIRIMSTIQNYMPLTLRVFITSNIRLCGLPFMAGFYSKDLILEFIIIRGINIFLFLIIVVSTALTVIYSCRLVFMLRSNFFVFEPLSGIEDYDTIIVLRFLFLFSPSIFGGLARR
jgi:NADH-ubiquinone oxidoreductase chain 5